MRLAPVFDKVLAGWKAQGYKLVPMRTLYESLTFLLPRCEVGPGRVPGRSGTLFSQGDEFLGDVDLAQAA
jgi:undecaprenyl phosphate-alpha-L-ara4FN deformylase